MPQASEAVKTLAQDSPHDWKELGSQVTISFTIESVELDGGIKTSRATWDDHSHKGTADNLLIERTKDGGAISNAMEFIRAELSDGWVLSKELEANALEHGIKPSTFRDAYERIPVVRKREPGGRGKWYAMLPEHLANWEAQQTTKDT